MGGKRDLDRFHSHQNRDYESGSPGWRWGEASFETARIKGDLIVPKTQVSLVDFPALEAHEFANPELNEASLRSLLQADYRPMVGKDFGWVELERYFRNDDETKSTALRRRFGELKTRRAEPSQLVRLEGDSRNVEGQIVEKSIEFKFPSCHEYGSIKGQLSQKGALPFFLAEANMNLELRTLKHGTVEITGGSCDGDVFVDAPVLLDDVNIESGGEGCRIYSSHTIAIMGSVRATGDSDDRNIQLSSCRAIIAGFTGMAGRMNWAMGYEDKTIGEQVFRDFRAMHHDLRDARERHPVDPAGPQKLALVRGGRYRDLLANEPWVTALRDSGHDQSGWWIAAVQDTQPLPLDLSAENYRTPNIWTLSTGVQRQGSPCLPYSDRRIQTTSHLLSPAEGSMNLVHSEIDCGVAWPRNLLRTSIDFERLLLHAPVIHNRFLGNMTGVVMGSDVLFAVGEFHFNYDDVFSRVPILSALPARPLAVD